MYGKTTREVARYVHHHFEDRIIFSLKLSCDFFPLFYRTFDKNSRNFNDISSPDPNVPSSIKWRKKIAQRVLRARCKKKTFVFETVVDLVAKKIFSRFYARLNFYNFSKISSAA